MVIRLKNKHIYFGVESVWNQLDYKFKYQLNQLCTANSGLAGGYSGFTPTVRFCVKPTGAINITPITSTEASAITPAEGDIVMVSNTNGTFTSIGFWGYQNGSWQKM